MVVALLLSLLFTTVFSMYLCLLCLLFHIWFAFSAFIPCNLLLMFSVFNLFL